MTIKVAALYQFVPLPDFRALREPLYTLCRRFALNGSLLLAEEGVNGAVAGTPVAVDAFVAELRHGELFRGRLNNLELKFSPARAMPFRRLKVRLKKEIVTLGAREANPVRQVGTYVEASEWNALIAQPDVLLLDTRNDFEVAMGTFDGALDPAIRRFGEFKDFAAGLDPACHGRIAMFCTGGIRCEKASSYLLAKGFSEVYHLKGGILRYLETVPAAESRWRGECFVFDDRVALGHGLQESAPGERAE